MAQIAEGLDLASLGVSQIAEGLDLASLGVSQITQGPMQGCDSARDWKVQISRDYECHR